MSEDRSSRDEPFRGEGEDDQSKRRMSELMTEVRIVMPGVQVLFAFLLTVPFQSAFEEVTDTERILYVLTVLSSAVGSAMSCATGLVISFLWSPLAGWLTLTSAALLFGSLWFALPLARRAMSDAG